MDLQFFLSGVAVCAAIIYSFLLLLRTGRSRHSLLLVGVMVLFCLLDFFDLMALRHPERLFFWKRCALCCEALLPLVLIAFGLVFYRAGGLERVRGISRFFLFSSFLFLAPVLVLGPRSFFFSPDFGEEKILFLTQAGFFFYILLMAYITYALILLEQTLLSLSVHERWAVKFEIVGASLPPVVALVYYSQSLLYRSLDMDFLPVRSVALLFGVGLMAFSRFKRGGGNPISVSRSVAFHSLVVMALGVYLIGLGLLGQGMRYLGLSSQKNFFTIIAVLSGCGLLALLLSENLRRKANVFLHKNFFRNKYDYRQQWLEFTHRLSQASSFKQLQDRVLAFFCETFGFTGATLYLKDGKSGELRVSARFRVAPGAELVSRDDPLVCCLEERDWVFNPRDQPPDDCEAEGGFVDPEKVSLVVPLRLAGKLEGLVVCGRLINPRESFSYEDYDLLKALARQTTLALVTQRLSEELGMTREMAAMGKVSAFVLHDLKNQVSSLSLMVENAANFIDDPEFQQDMLETLGGTIGKMKKLMARLNNLRVEPELELHEVDLVKLAEKVAAGFEQDVRLMADGPVRLNCDPEKISTVLLNLLLNALEADSAHGSVELEIGVGERKEAFFRVRDRGCGMSAEFIENHLFKPFSTTKKKGLGIGLYQCKQIVEAHGGRMEVESEPGVGTVFSVCLPQAAGPVSTK